MSYLKHQTTRPPLNYQTTFILIIIIKFSSQNSPLPQHICMLTHQCFSSTSNRHNFKIDRVYTLSPTFTFTTRTYPSLLFMTSTVRPSGHFPRDVSGEITSTTSPASKFRHRVCHIFLEFKDEIYSVIHLSQKC